MSAEFKSVKDLFEQFLDASRLRAKFKEKEIISAWSTIAGKAVAGQTGRIWLSTTTLHISLQSPALKNNMMLHKSDVLKRFQKEFGANTVTDIIIH